MARKHDKKSTQPRIGTGPFPPHPFSSIFPLHDGPGLTELRDSIAANGQREDIVLLMGEGRWKVLDGNGRQAACFALGKTPRYRVWGSREGDGANPIDWVVDVNMRRRHMSDAQRTLAAVKYANMKRGDNQHTAANAATSKPSKTSPSKPASRKDAAQKFDVSEAEFERAKKVTTNGTKELQEAYAAGEVTVSDAQAICDETPSVQRKAVHEDAEGGRREDVGAGAGAHRLDRARLRSGD